MSLYTHISINKTFHWNSCTVYYQADRQDLCARLRIILHPRIQTESPRMCLTNVLGPFSSITNVFHVNARQDLFIVVFKHYVYVLIYFIGIFHRIDVRYYCVCLWNYNTVYLYRRIIIPWVQITKIFFLKISQFHS